QNSVGRVRPVSPNTPRHLRSRSIAVRTARSPKECRNLRKRRFRLLGNSRPTERAEYLRYACRCSAGHAQAGTKPQHVRLQLREAGWIRLQVLRCPEALEPVWGRSAWPESRPKRSPAPAWPTPEPAAATPAEPVVKPAPIQRFAESAGC